MSSEPRDQYLAVCAELQHVVSERDALRALLLIARDALADIALAGMSLPMVCGDDKEAKNRYHAKQAWEFIGIAARAKFAIDAALAGKDKP